MRIRIPHCGKVTLHRWLWEHYHGKVPEGYELHHTCLNQNCCNIEHLELLTTEEHIDLHMKLRKEGKESGGGIHFYNQFNMR